MNLFKITSIIPLKLDIKYEMSLQAHIFSFEKHLKLVGRVGISLGSVLFLELCKVTFLGLFYFIIDSSICK